MSAPLISLSIKNFPQLESLLKNAPKDIKEKVIRKVLIAGATRIAKAAKSLAPKDSHRLEQAIGTKWAREGKWDVSRDMFVKAGTKRKDSAGAYYGAMVEFGHWATGSARKGEAKNGAKPRWIGPKHFALNAFNSCVDQITKEFEQKVTARLEKELAKVA